jgi:ribosomal-protein-alanine N-acetyltransferase
MTPPVLDTARLRLSPVTLDDAPFLVELLNDPGFLRWIGDRGVRTAADVPAYLQNGPWAMYEKHGFGLMRVSLRDSGENVGLCGLLKRDWLTLPDIGFSFLQRHCARGYGRESAGAVIEEAERRLGVRSVGAIVAPDNAASIGLLERLGFAYRHPVTPPGEQREISFYSRNSAPISSTVR